MNDSTDFVYSRLANLTNGAQVLLSMATPDPDSQGATSLIVHTWAGGKPFRDIFVAEKLIDVLGLSRKDSATKILDALISDEAVPAILRERVTGGNAPEDLRQAISFDTPMGPLIVCTCDEENRFVGPRLCVHFNGAMGVKEFKSSQDLSEHFGRLSSENLMDLLKDKAVQDDAGEALAPLIAMAEKRVRHRSSRRRVGV